MDLNINDIPRSYGSEDIQLNKRALSIIRISSDIQKIGSGIESQWEDDILPNAPLLGLEVCEKLRRIIVERATDWHRLQFADTINEAIKLYKKGEIEAVLFARVDRETRFIFSSMPLLSMMLQTGLGVYFARELLFLNPKDPEAVIRYLDKVGQSQAYIETMRVNTMWGRRNRARGKKGEGIPGRLPTGGVNLYGYIYDKVTSKRLINDFEAEVIRKIIHWLLRDRLSLKGICRRLIMAEISAPRGGRYWSTSTVSRILKNEVYTGVTYALRMEAVEPQTRKKLGSYPKSSRKMRPRDEWILLPEDTTPQIVTPAEYKLIQKQLARNSALSPRNQKHTYLLRSFIYCQICRRKYYGVPQHGKRYYRCSGHSSNSILGDPCRNRTVNANKFEDQVWQLVVRNLMNPDEVLKLQRGNNSDLQIKEWHNEVDTLNKKLALLNSAEERLIRLFAVTSMSEAKIKEELDKIREQRKETEKSIVEYETNIHEYNDSPLTEEQVEALIVLIREILLQSGIDDKANFDRKRLLLEELDLKVWIAADNSFYIDFTVPAVPAREYNITSTHS